MPCDNQQTIVIALYPDKHEHHVTTLKPALRATPIRCSKSIETN